MSRDPLSSDVVISTAIEKWSRTFNKVTSYLLPYPECCRLADPSCEPEIVLRTREVDSLSGFTGEMWDVLTDVVFEWFRLRLQLSNVPWDGPVCVPQGTRLLYCHDRSYARQAKHDIKRRYLSRVRESNSISVFTGCNMLVPDDFAREREGLEFIARQADHLASPDDFVFVIQEL